MSFSFSLHAYIENNVYVCVCVCVAITKILETTANYWNDKLSCVCDVSVWSKIERKKRSQSDE